MTSLIKIAALCASLAVSAASFGQPTLTDTNLSVDPVITVPGALLTGIAFIGPNDMLLNSKEDGRVHRVTNGVNTGVVLDLPVNNTSERGLLDIALHPDFASNNLVYLFYTRANADESTALSNRVSRFTWNGTALVNEQLIIDLPVLTGPNHDGGILKFGPPSAAASDQKLFIVIGDLNRDGKTQNRPAGANPDYTGQILRLNPDGTVPTGAQRGPFYDVAGGNANLEVMYAYGVRNSYGMDFDPVTDKLWDTENGPNHSDEINVVEPGFNSGWLPIMGMAPATLPTLVQFGPTNTYSDPEFVWQKPVAVTAIHFFRGNGLGASYQNACLVGDANLGKLYRFPLNGNRTGFALTGVLSDKVLNIGESDQQILLGDGFSGVMNMTTGPDGSLYVVTYNTVYRVRSNQTAVGDWELYQ